MRDYYPALAENQFHHIYNRGNNGDNLFYTTENYHYFLRKYHEHMSPYLDTFAYCLLPNHFHLLVRVKPGSGDARDIRDIRDTIAISDGILNIPNITRNSPASQAFRNFFIGYAQAIKKQEGRTGSLFQKNFKRPIVENFEYFRNVVMYIHANPQLHHICPDFRDYPFSSFQSFLSSGNTKLKRDEALQCFGSPEQFVEAHEKYVFHVKKEMYDIED